MPTHASILTRSLFSSSWNKYPEVMLLDHMVALFLIFEGNLILFPIVATSVYTHTNSTWGLPFLHTLTTLVISCLFDNRCEVMYHHVFDLHFADD